MNGILSQQHSCASRGKEQPCLLQIRLSVQEEKAKRERDSNKEHEMREGWEFEGGG